MVSTSRNRRARRGQVSGGREAAAGVCAVADCGERARSRCSRCSRAVCNRHAGAALGQRSRRERGSASEPASRCALCRLEQRRARQRTMRRIWLTLYVAAFGVFTAIAALHNPVQGLALLALGGVILAMAYAYDRILRHR